MTREEKLNALEKDSVFMERFKAVADMEEVHALLKEYDADISDEELDAFYNQHRDVLDSIELSAEDLDSVSGGSITLGSLATGILIIGGGILIAGAGILLIALVVMNSRSKQSKSSGSAKPLSRKWR